MPHPTPSTHPRPAGPSVAPHSATRGTDAAEPCPRHHGTLEALLLALLLALLAQLAPARRRPTSHPATTIVPGQRHAPGRAPHALAFALRLVPDWIFSLRNRGMAPHARTLSIAPSAAARDPPSQLHPLR